MPEYFSIKDAANYLGVEYKTVWRLVHSGELPAVRFGPKLFRIDRQDLAVYLAANKMAAGTTGISSPDETLLCGFCGRVIPSIDMSGGTCSEETCEEILCTTCWGRGQRQCRTHQPTTEMHLAQARLALSQGKVDRLVTALEARQREQAFLARFEERVFGVAAVQHPLTGEVLQIKDWHDFREYTDESRHLLELLGVAYLEHSVLATTPVNAEVRFDVSEGVVGRNRPRQGLVLEARCVSDVKALIDHRLVTKPATLADLMFHLTSRQLKAEQDNTLWVSAIASTSGWDQESIDYIVASPDGRSYRHRLLLPLLVDLHGAHLVYNTTDDRLKGFAGLFDLPQEVERILRIRRLIEAKIRSEYRRGGVTFNEILEENWEDPVLVRRAFEQLAEDRQRYKFVQDPDAGGMLLIKP